MSGGSPVAVRLDALKSAAVRSVCETDVRRPPIRDLLAAPIESGPARCANTRRGLDPTPSVEGGETLAEDTDNAPPDCPAWCTTNHQTEIGEPVHWTPPATVETSGDQLGGGVKETVSITGSLSYTDRPPGRVHVDTRIGKADRWHHAITTTAGQARTVAVKLLDVAELVRE
jgi:hypothetical protein